MASKLAINLSLFDLIHLFIHLSFLLYDASVHLIISFLKVNHIGFILLLYLEKVCRKNLVAAALPKSRVCTLAVVGTTLSGVAPTSLPSWPSMRQIKQNHNRQKQSRRTINMVQRKKKANSSFLSLGENDEARKGK